MEILKLCRSCMKEVASWELENFNANAVSMFTYCTNVEISEDDKLPKQFCYDCTIKIESSYTFIKKAQDVNITLKNLISRALTSVIVKSENFTNNLHFNESNALQSDLGFNLDVKFNKNEEKGFNLEDKINKNEENMFTPNSIQGCETKVEQDAYPSAVVNEINESLVNKDFELPEISLNSNTNYFDADSEEVLTDDDYNLQSVGENKIKNTQSNDANNQRNETKTHEENKEVTAVKVSTKKIYCTRSKTRQSYEIKKEKKEKRNGKQIEDKDTVFKCHICKNIYRYKSRLQKHIRSKHSKDIKEEDRDKPKVQEEKGENTNPDLKTCDICERTFTSALWFSRHIEKEHSDYAKQYFCPHCTKTFTSYDAWRYHRDKHAESRRFACEVCGARFRRGKQLAAHARSHATARPHVCTKCGMAFKIKSILTSHVKLHLDERPFLCSVCGFSTKLLTTLKAHMLTHTGEKPYACKKCPFRSATGVNLRRHELRHRGEKPHVCQHCGKRFYEPGSLARHVRIHTGERPYQCFLCSQSFSDGWRCKTHIMRSHRVPLDDIPRLSKVKTTIDESTTQPA